MFRIRSHRRRACLAGVILTALAAASSPEAGAGPAAPRVIAMVGDSGINPLHIEFARPDIEVPSRIPVGATIAVGDVATIDDLRRSGDLGALAPDVLTHVAGTNVLVVNPGSGAVDLLDDPSHGTRVAAAAGGATAGTDPDAVLVFVHSAVPEAYAWVARQTWIDVVTTSTMRTSTECNAYSAPVDQLLSDGVQVFSAAGNGATDTPASALGAPGSLPGVYRVGGIDDNGAPHGLHTGGPGNPGPRGYDSGDQYAHEKLPDPESFGDYLPEDGTSFATPHTAGRAAQLVAVARDALGDVVGPGPRGDGRLAIGAPAGEGVLADGDLTRDELVAMLHGMAVPFYPRSPASYVLEGWGGMPETAEASDLLLGPTPATAAEVESAWELDTTARAARAEATRCS